MCQRNEDCAIDNHIEKRRIALIRGCNIPMGKRVQHPGEWIGAQSVTPGAARSKFLRICRISVSRMVGSTETWISLVLPYRPRDTVRARMAGASLSRRAGWLRYTSAFRGGCFQGGLGRRRACGRGRQDHSMASNTRRLAWSAADQSCYRGFSSRSNSRRTLDHSEDAPSSVNR